jgi:hypothetical protein
VRDGTTQIVASKRPARIDLAHCTPAFSPIREWEEEQLLEFESDREYCGASFPPAPSKQLSAVLAPNARFSSLVPALESRG